MGSSFAAEAAARMVESHQTGAAFHPFTCGNNDHDWRADGLDALTVEVRGNDIYLTCPCGYEQRVTAVDMFMISAVAAQSRPFDIQS